MEKFLLRDVDDLDFIKLINNKEILTTRDLTEAIIFDDITKANVLKEYIELENDNYDLEIVKIELEVVDE